MKSLHSAVIACACLVALSAIAQESGRAGAPESRQQRATSVPAPGAVDAVEALDGSVANDSQELTRAERRALRRSEQEQSEQVAEAAAAEESAGEDEGIICRRESVIGTHRRIRICTTRAERDAAREAAQDVFREVSRSFGELGPEAE